MEELKFGIIGTGWPGQQHAIALAEIPDVQLRSCADTNSERLRSFAETYRLESSFEDYQELLRDRDLDAAIICLPNFLHFPASLTALEAGKHVLCEKPPTMNGAEMKVLREEALKRKLVYYFSRQFRFTAAMRTAKAAVDEGRLGKIYHAQATFVRLETSWAGNLTDDIPPRKYFGQELVNSTLYGTKASVRLNPLTLFEDRDGELVTVPLDATEDEPNGFELQLRNFLESIFGEAE